LPFKLEGTRKTALGDFDNNGTLDRLIISPTFALQRTKPDGTKEPIAMPKLPSPVSSADWADIDRDGNLDIVAVSGGRRVHILLGDGRGAFRDGGKDWVFPQERFSSPVKQLVAFDAEPDGDEDLYFQLEDGSWVQWRYVSIHGRSGSAFLEASPEGDLEGCTLELTRAQKSFGARKLVSTGAGIGEATSRAVWFLPPGPCRISLRRPGEQDAVKSIHVQAPVQRIVVTPGKLFALYPERAVEIDGRMSPGEWDDAPKAIHALSYVDFKTKKEEQHPLTLWYRADSYALYLCIKIEADDFGDSRNADMLHVFFDNDGDTNIEHGEDARSFWSDIFNDYFIRKQPYRTWWERDPFLDGRGAVTHSNPKGIGDYVYEMMIPWQSHDPLDLGITKDGELGIKVTFAETRKHGNFWSWGGMGRDGFPDSMQSKGRTYARLKVTGLSRKPGEGPGKVSLALSLPTPERTLKGKVMAKGGDPIAGAKVRLTHSPSPSQGQRVVTDEEGRYELPFEPVQGQKEFGRQAEHWVFVTSDAHAALAVQIGENDPEHNFTLETGLSVGGVIFDPNGQPLAGADVALHYGQNNWITAQVRSDPNGRFRFQHQPPGELTIRARHRERKLYHSRPIQAGKEDMTIDLGPPIRVAGQVTDAETGAPVKQFTLHWGGRYKHNDQWSTAFWSDRDVREFKTNDGSFEHKFGKYGEVRFFLCLIAPGRAPLIPERSFSAGDGVEGLKLAMGPGAVASGKVEEEGAGKPIAGAKVRFWWRTSGGKIVKHPDQFATTGPNGEFQIDSLAEAAYSITTSAAGYANHVQLDTPIGPETESLLIRLHPGASIRGIYQLEGKPAREREVGVYRTDLPGHSQGMPSTPCGRHGDFAFTNLVPGSYLLFDVSRVPRVRQPGITATDVAALARFELKAGDDLKLQVGTERGGATVQGEVKAGNGEPAKQTLVLLEGAAGAAAYFCRWTAVTDNEGRYVLKHVPPGPYRIAAGKSGQLDLEAGELLTVPKEAKSVEQDLRAMK